MTVREKRFSIIHSNFLLPNFYFRAAMRTNSYLFKRRPKTPFFCDSGSGRLKCLQMTDSSFSSDMSDLSTTISSPAIIAGATGKSNLAYASLLNSSHGLDIISIPILYFWSKLSIFLKCFHVLPLGLFKINLTFSMFPSVST